MPLLTSKQINSLRAALLHKCQSDLTSGTVLPLVKALNRKTDSSHGKAVSHNVEKMDPQYKELGIRAKKDVVVRGGERVVATTTPNGGKTHRQYT